MVVCRRRRGGGQTVRHTQREIQIEASKRETKILRKLGFQRFEEIFFFGNISFNFKIHENRSERKNGSYKCHFLSRNGDNYKSVVL